jgi:hypothetical protein
VTPVTCLACGTDNEPGRKFYGELAEARDVFERLRATPRLERVDALESHSAQPATGTT